jgi:AraC-like DNA-binding protein
MALSVTADADLFMQDPVGRCLVGPSWLYWCADPELYGIAFWGRPAREGVGALTRALEVELGAKAVPHRSLVDASRLESVDAEAFELLSAYVRNNHRALAVRVTRLALIRPKGLTGATAAGFFAVLDAPYPVSVLDDAAAALASLDHDIAVLADIAAILSDVTGIDPVVASLRAVLADDLVSADLARAARGLGLSERSLQRKLRAAGTTFQSELNAVRLREARQKMMQSNAPLTRIALDVGYPSLSHFSTQFRKDCGQTPSQWRARKADRNSDS